MGSEEVKIPEKTRLLKQWEFNANREQRYQGKANFVPCNLRVYRD